MQDQLLLILDLPEELKKNIINGFRKNPEKLVKEVSSGFNISIAQYELFFLFHKINYLAKYPPSTGIIAPLK